MRFRWSASFLFTILIIITGCVAEREATPSSTSTPVLTSVDFLSTDSVWVLGDNTQKTLRVVVNEARSADSVLIVISNSDLQLSVKLLDDGGAESLPIGWIAGSSGDLIPNDGIWSIRVQGSFSNVIANYSVRVKAFSGARFVESIQNWQTVTNQPPQITGIWSPDSLRSGADSVLEVSVLDPDTLFSNRIGLVFASLVNSSGSTLRNPILDQVSGGQRWRLPLPYTFTANLPTASYTIHVTAFDWLGAEASDSTHIWLENLPPLPDSVRMVGSTVMGNSTVIFDSTASDTVRFSFQVSINDPQGDLDVRYLRVILRRGASPDTSYDTTLVEGMGYDLIQGDGSFTMPFQLDNRNRPGHPRYTRAPYDTYYIGFTPQDGGNNTGRDTLFTFRIQPPTGPYRKHNPVVPSIRSVNPFVR